MNFGSKNDLKRPKMNFEESSYFSNVRKNSKKKCHIFGKDFSVKKWGKKNSKKNAFWFFSKKKYFFDVFLILFFSWKTDKLDPKLVKVGKNMCLCHINNLGGKK